MARLTSEVAALKIGNRYDLILIGSRRARELHRGWRSLVDCKNGAVVTAIREMEQGKIGREYLQKPPQLSRNEKES